ncbi:NAD-dependent epimerase/dehydratase family protein [Microbacterium sp. KSW-18]|uniref:NAD-dependent epimerase/dehydratase family protein n=1 Tax=Microbacterium aquilitoris TaxID=3067307 RepID=A0ABU3GIN6_9MICO|nr:NAD-dependent epimerase/dehydratase family protein [Microbacterium sp. KSW-18]MDT3330557.1 NAD-dependent epimerase/dehydratase family protein [Microbacterium sp. KSW-18]
MPEQTARGGEPTPHAPVPHVTGSATIDGDVAEIIGQTLPWDDLAGKTVLVTGAAGMIPAYAVYTLLGLNDVRDAGITVLALVRDVDKARRQFADAADREDLLFVHGDVRHAIEIDRPVDLVIHGASPARPSLHAASPVDTIRANVTGAFGLLDLCVASPGARFVLMSSAEVYGQRVSDGSLVAEDEYGSVDILNPRASYTEGKRAAETIAVSYHAQHGVPITIARFGHIYGPGMALDDGRVQADFTADVLAGRDITLNSDGSARRTYTYLADAVSGMFAAILQGEDTAYNVSDRDGFISIRELAEAFTRARPEKDLTVRFAEGVDHRRYNSVKGQGLDDTRLRSLGWAPHVGLGRGLDRTIAWHEERGEGNRS